MNQSAYSVFNAMTDIIASPGKALDEIKQHTSWLWWPLLINMLLAAGMLLYYYSWVDFGWLVEETIRQTPPESRAESADAIRNFMQPGRTSLFSVIAVVVISMLVYTLQATYFHLVNKMTSGAEIRFGQWFSFSTWTAFVGVFGTLTALVMIFLADNNQISTQDLQVLSINSLLLHARAGEPWFTWASTLSLLTVWTLVLMSLGYARWTGASMMKSTIIAILPWVLIFGIWAARI